MRKDCKTVTSMNLYGLLGVLLIFVAQLACADSIRFVRVTGGPPLPGVSDAQTEMGLIQGVAFEKIRVPVQQIISVLVKDGRWLAEKRVWWDVGPDAGFISAIVDMDGKSYTINSWFPLERQSANIAVSETRGICSSEIARGEGQD